MASSPKSARSPAIRTAGSFSSRRCRTPAHRSSSRALTRCTRYDLRITGQGFGGVQDSFQFAFVNRDSDNESEIGITARVDGINAPNYPNPYAGVMIRKFGDTTPNVPAYATRFAAIVVTKDKESPVPSPRQ